MYVIKADGTRQEFMEEKIINTCVRAGLSRRHAKNISQKIHSNAHDGITTHEIFQLISKEIDLLSGKNAYYMDLRDSIARMDSESFEIYTKELLELNGYKASWNKLIKGRYVEHQVDVVASKGGKTFLVECKHHSNPHRFTGLGTCLQVQARMEDINAAGHRFDGAWIFTNNKFSEHAKTYSKGIGIRLTGWKYENKFSLECLIEEKRAFPVTILDLKKEEIEALLKKRVVTIQDVLQKGRKSNPREFDQAEAATKL